MLFYLCIILTDPATITLVHLRIRDDVQKNKNIVYDFFCSFLLVCRIYYYLISN